MTIIERYIVRFVFTGFGLVALVLLTLMGLFDLAEQLEDVGEGAYRFNDALWHVALVLPRRFVDLAPFIALIGTLIGLGLLTIHHELTAMVAVGKPPYRLVVATLLAATGLVGVQAISAGWLAPFAEQTAITKKRRLAQNDASTGAGYWARSGNQFLRIGGLRHGRIPVDIELFELTNKARLGRYIHAREADIRGPNRWLLEDAVVKRFSTTGRKQEHLDSIAWQPFLDLRELTALQMPAESLSPFQLQAYIHELRQSDRDAQSYVLMLWRKAGDLIMTLAMGLLAVPFATRGSPRSSLAPRLLGGALTGIGIFIADQVLVRIGSGYGFAPQTVAMTPPLVLAGAAVGLLGVSNKNG
jgi:lipopolysaccharide export system permease protein